MSSRSVRYGLVLGCIVTAFLTPAWSAAAEASNAGTVWVSDAITNIAKQALNYAGVLAAASTVSMAFLELLKAVTDFRRRFQQWRLNKWLDSSKRETLPELLYLAIGDKIHSDALCGQPIEKMMGQIQAAARIALDYPEKFPNLFEFLTTSDLEDESSDKPVASAAPEDRRAWRSQAAVVHDVGSRLVAGVVGADAVVPGAVAQAASDAAQARARLASLVGRKLDGFQLQTDFLWSRLNQGLSIVIAIVIMEIAVFSFGDPAGQKVWASAALAQSALLGLLGGLLAPFAKDFSQSLASFASK